MQRASADIALPHDGHQLQQLFLLFPTSLRSSLRRYLADGGRSVHGWTAALNSVIVDCAQQPDAFLNINTAADLQRADQVLSPITVTP